MSHRLNILAIEPYHGGFRREMLESLKQRSRHHWRIMKLPARRMERRLSAAAAWFAECLARQGLGKIDVLFTSEAINLSDLFRLVPQLLRRPTVVYFHDNQLNLTDTSRPALDIVNLSTASSAHEVWFNSQYHFETFRESAANTVRRYPEIAGGDPVGQLDLKAKVIAPPVECDFASTPEVSPSGRRRSVFVETADCELDLCRDLFRRMVTRGEHFQLYTVGNRGDLPDEIPHQRLSEFNQRQIIDALRHAGTFMSFKFGATFDAYAIKALWCGCWPLCPRDGMYADVLPEMIHSSCLHDGAIDTLMGRMLDAWHLEHLTGYEQELAERLSQYDAEATVERIDEELDRVASGVGVA